VNYKNRIAADKNGSFAATTSTHPRLNPVLPCPRGAGKVHFLSKGFQLSHSYYREAKVKKKKKPSKTTKKARSGSSLDTTTRLPKGIHLSKKRRQLSTARKKAAKKTKKKEVSEYFQIAVDPGDRLLILQDDYESPFTSKKKPTKRR
jgi:hypothetical protein